MERKYNPNGLLDAAAAKLGVKNDAALSRALNVAPPLISKLRNYRLPVGDSMILRLHEIVGMPVPLIRSFLDGAQS